MSRPRTWSAAAAAKREPLDVPETHPLGPVVCATCGRREGEHICWLPGECPEAPATTQGTEQ